MKRLIAIDDGYFPHRYKSLRGPAPIVGVLGWREHIDDIAVRYTLVDCPDVSIVIRDLARELSYRGYNIDAIATHSVIMSGFSIYDPVETYRVLGIPLIVVFDHDIDLGRIKRALEKHFRDHEYRFSIIAEIYRGAREIITSKGRLRVKCVGLDIGRCIDIVRENQTAHPMPQPLRHADIIASGIGRFMAGYSIAPTNIICEPENKYEQHQ